MLCLNMIVKNESKIITRLLESVVDYIDCYCICDTGSTDNTTDIITSFFESRDINGSVTHKEFVNFSYNRNYAYHHVCQHMDNVTHVLFLDADMIFNTSLSKQELQHLYIQHDACYLYQGSLNCHYKNVRIVKKIPEYKYIGATHEYFDLCNSFHIHTISDDLLFIKDVGDGGSKTNKFQRDIHLLIKALNDEPNNSRYVFYLANSYKDCGELDNAIKYYLQRISMGGWIQEIWCSYYNIGLCYASQNDDKNALWYWLKAFEVFDKRIENLYQIVKYYRICSQHELAYSFYLLAKRCMKSITLESHLFLEKDVYLYKLDYEYSIFAFYVNMRDSGIYWKLMHNTMVDVVTHQSICENYRYYNSILSEKCDVVQNIKCPSIPGFYPSSPSFIMHNGKMKVNIRYVNYKIRDDGSYQYNPPITTKNMLMNYNVDTNTTTNDIEVSYDDSYDNQLYCGNEDVRLLLSSNGECYYSSNIGFENGNIGIHIGKYRLKQGALCGNHVVSPINNSVEKNWVLFEKDGDIQVIYTWQPLTIGTLCNNENDYIFVENHVSNEKNHYLNDLRGSTNGIYVDGYWWFICHKVFMCNGKRKYYHILVRMDHAFNLLYSEYFVFENMDIEYCLGLVYCDDWFYIGYSMNDNNSKIMKIRKDKIYATIIQ